MNIVPIAGAVALSPRESIYCPPIYLNISRLKSAQFTTVLPRPDRNLNKTTNWRKSEFFMLRNVIFPDKILNLNNRTYICVCISSKVVISVILSKISYYIWRGKYMNDNCRLFKLFFFNWRLECKYVVSNVWLLPYKNLKPNINY